MMETQLHDDASYAHMLFKKLQPTATIILSRQILYSHFITHLQVQLVPIPSVETGHAAVDTFSPNLPERY